MILGFFVLLGMICICLIFDFGSILGQLQNFGSPQLLFRAENSVRYALCRLGIRLFNQVGIDILGGAHLSVSKPFGNAHRVCAGEAASESASAV